MPSPIAKTVGDPLPAPGPRQGVRDIVRALARLIVGDADPRVLWFGWLATTVVCLGMVAMNILTRLHMSEISNLIEPPWRVITDELSSGLMLIVLYPVLARLATLQTPWMGDGVRFVVVQGCGAVGFVIVHVALFVLARLMIYGLFGEVYEFGGVGAFLYETPKELISYCVCVGGFWAALLLFQAVPEAAPAARAMFDIRDNARVLRVPIDDILAVRSAGNYVEFLLADGRRPLMRQTLAETAEQLTPHGLARTHRSWLVNKHRIAQIEPSGSGDFKLTLSESVEAPLSRRFKGAIEG